MKRLLFATLALTAIATFASSDSSQPSPKKQAAFRFGVAERQNERPTMEDRYMIQEENGFFAVYDGHGGHQVADYAKQHLHQELLRRLALNEDPAAALDETFKTIHNKLDSMGKPIANGQGTTATVALIKDGKLHIAWVGDSRAVYSHYQSGDLHIEKTTDHKPLEIAEELSRCMNAGARCIKGYIASKSHCLAVTRALGDKDMATVGVIPTPGLQQHTLRPSDEFLILASDGIWDFMSNGEALKIVRDEIQAGATYQEAAQALIDEAVEEAKDRQEFDDFLIDNMTAIVVSLRGFANPTEKFAIPDGSSEESLSTDSSDSETELILGAQQTRAWFQKARNGCDWVKGLLCVAAHRILNAIPVIGM